MELGELQRKWDTLGKDDPLWAIIGHEEKSGNKWDLAQFFRSGDQDIREVMQYVSGLTLSSLRQDALDFGCGVGRLTQPLGRYFARMTGIDIAPSIIAQARAFDREQRCQFMLNERADLSVCPDRSFDFVYSNPVLQHMRRSVGCSDARGLLCFRFRAGASRWRSRGPGRIPSGH